ncbi:cytochrome c biogenesis protein CcsA [Halomonas denitrificans]|nr:cytochrome c biogenesis protein CcsA [Halomonas denitrificans]
MTPSLPVIIASALYLLAAPALAVGLRDEHSGARALGLLLAVAALLGHGWIELAQMRAVGGFTADFFSSLSLVALIVNAILLAACIRFPVLELLPVALPGAALLLVLQGVFSPEPTALALADPRIEIHVISSLLAYSVLLIAAMNAIFIFVQHQMLHRRRSARLLDALPPLTSMERLLFQLIAAGWLLLCVSLGTGLVFVDDLFAQHLVHKTVLSLLAWLIFGVLLYGRWRHGWRGMRVVRLCLVGMVVLLLAYFGSKAVLELVLDRRWQAD